MGERKTELKMELNKIYLGDCNELIKQIPDRSIQIIYTDVPYLYQMGGGGSHLMLQNVFAPVQIA